MTESTPEKWDIEIYPNRGLFEINIRELWEFKELLWMFIKRDIITVYKQTIFGPIWYFVQPILTMLIYIVVFTNIANIPTDSIHPVLFYLAGIVMWNYFSDCFSQTSDTFFQNASIFGKVYFPRIIIPISKIISSLIKFFIQAILFFMIYIYFYIRGSNLNPGISVLLLPFYLMLMGCMGLGVGILFTSLTTKYRDLKFVINTFIQLLMYATPVIYPMSILSENYYSIIFLNPLSHIIEGFKYSFFGTGELNYYGLLYTSIFTFLIFGIGILVFNKTERVFMDTI